MEFMWKIREKHPAPKWVVGDNDCNVKFDKPKN